jgi:hypothetical protein
MPKNQGHRQMNRNHFPGKTRDKPPLLTERPERAGDDALPAPEHKGINQ